MMWFWGMCLALTVVVWCAAAAADTIDRRRWRREQGWDDAD